MIKDNLRAHGHLQFIWRGHDNSDIFVQACQSDLYTVTHKLRYDVLTPNVEKKGENITCGLSEILKGKLECVDLFVMDII